MDEPYYDIPYPQYQPSTNYEPTSEKNFQRAVELSSLEKKHRSSSQIQC